MKKVLFIFLLLMFTSLTAGAIQVNYGVCGVPVSVYHGRGVYTSVNNFGSNAAFLPQNRMRAAQRMRARRFAQTRAQIIAQQRANGLLPPPPPTMYNRPTPPISRFNRGYTISSGRSYIRNGIRYFD